MSDMSDMSVMSGISGVSVISGMSFWIVSNDLVFNGLECSDDDIEIWSLLRNCIPTLFHDYDEFFWTFSWYP